MREFCSICGIVLSDTFYKCTKCARLTCPACQSHDEKCCIDCAVAEPSEVEPKKKLNSAYMRPMRLSPELSAIVGEGPMPRTEVTKQLWVYIKKNRLQDPENRRMINADESLTAIFDGREQVNMFEMTGLVAKHILK